MWLVCRVALITIFLARPCLIGVDTALNTIIRAIDSLRDTASSHQRAFLVETMGRSSGYLAVTSGIVGGAELAIIPEHEITVEEVIKEVNDAYDTW